MSGKRNNDNIGMSLIRELNCLFYTSDRVLEVGHIAEMLKTSVLHNTKVQEIWHPPVQYL
jgi:hypothetical protein